MAGSTGDPGERKPEGFTTQLFILAATVATTIASGVGNIIASDFQHRQPLMFALLGAVVVVLSGWYVLRQRRSRRAALAARATSGPAAEPVPPRSARILSPTGQWAAPAGEAAVPAPAAPPARNWVIAVMCALVAAAFFTGYWTIGNGFAHSDALGFLALAGVLGCVAAAMTIAWYCRRRRWAAWLLPGSRMAMACTVAALGLSAGGTLGNLDLVPPCPVPMELPVLSSAEGLAGTQNAITKFEQDERSILHQACYAVDLTAYAAPSDAAAETALESGWGAGALSASGPRPAIWIPASSAEVDTVSAALAEAGSPAPQLGPPESIASSHLVIAVPTDLVSRDGIFGADTSGSLDTVYGLLAGHGISLGLPSPRQSATGLLGVARLYGDLKPGAERAIEASGNFPADSATLLCAAAQTAQQAQAAGRQPPPFAYLVSEAAVNMSNAGQLTEGACPTLTAPPPPLTALYPSDATSLDFPFVTLNWGGDPAAQLAGGQEQRQRYEMDFYHWLASPAGRAALEAGDLSAPQPPTAPPPSPSQMSSALARFTEAQAPTRVLVAIDDSGPMEPYLPQIESATVGALGTGTPARSSGATGSPLGARDSFGVWAYPGSGAATHAEPVPFGSATAARRGSVAASVSTLRAHDHSAQFDLLTDAASILYGQQPGSGAGGASNGPINSVVLLTDGDSHAQDPGSSNFVTVTRTALRPPGLPAQSRIKVFVIAFGAAGCAQTPASAAQSLEALATSAGGTCVNASGDLTRQLSLLISQVAGG
jgi:hypothetical protein